MKRALLLVFVAACGRQEAPVVEPQPQPLTGLPCDVRQALQSACARCHVGAIYIPGFATRDDLLMLGARVSERLTSAERPMPPERQWTVAEREVVSRWVAEGMPAGDCGALQ